MFLGIIFTLAAVILEISADPVMHGSSIEHPSEFPYIAKLSIYFIGKNLNNDTKQKNKICVGVIATKKIVLTAAHCLHDPDMTIYQILVIAGRINSNISNPSEQQRTVDTYQVHGKFQATKTTAMPGEILPNDIAALWLNQTFEVNPFVKPANFPSKVVNVTNVIGVYAGWGLTEFGLVSTDLRKVPLKAITWQDCVQKYGFPISKNNFCALSLNGKSIPAVGDSGGPFIYNNEVIGLLSFGARTIILSVTGANISTCDPQKPLAFVNISKYMNWIRRAMKLKV